MCIYIEDTRPNGSMPTGMNELIKIRALPLTFNGQIKCWQSPVGKEGQWQWEAAGNNNNNGDRHTSAFSLEISNFMEITFCSYLNTNNIITTKFCTCHDSTAVMICAKFCSDPIVRNSMTALWYFHNIGISSETLSMRWTFGGDIL